MNEFTLRSIIVNSIKKVSLVEGDILILPDSFSAEYRALLRQEINNTHGDKKIGLIFVPDPINVRVFKPSEITFRENE